MEFRYIIAFLIILLFSCKNEGTKPAENEKVSVREGLYVNQTLLDSMDGNAVWYDIPRLCEQLILKAGDTIIFDNIWEQLDGTYRLSGDTVYPDQKPYGAAFPIVIGNNGQLNCLDTLHFKPMKQVVFVPSDKNFIEQLNDKLVAGKYQIVTDTGQKAIELKNDGNVEGWSWTKYELCISGDCADMSDAVRNVILFSNEDKMDFFTIRIEKSNGKRRLILKQLIEKSPDIKGEMKEARDSVILILDH